MLLLHLTLGTITAYNFLVSDLLPIMITVSSEPTNSKIFVPQKFLPVEVDREINYSLFPWYR